MPFLAVLAVPTAVLWAIQGPELLSVDDPRPLSAAVTLIEQRCHCRITYEDPKWAPEDVVEISGSVSHPADIRPRIPKGKRFAFSIPHDVSGRTPAHLRASMEQVLETFARSGSGPGAFQLTSDDTGLHVIPRSGSVLDVPVTMTRESRRIIDVVTATTSQVAQETGQTIGVATFPINLLKRPITLEAQQEAAHLVLDRALQASGRKLSWRLFYDVGMGQYYLGIHFVA